MKSEIVTTPERSRLMARIRQKDTSVEQEIRKIIANLGFEFECNATDLPGSPDLVNREGRWAIFVHGCFWHAHDGCKRWKIPKRNRAYWEKKFVGNKERDQRKIGQLRDEGYSVIVVWECELENPDKLERRLFVLLSPPKERYEFSHSGKSVIRTVCLGSGKNVESRVLLRDPLLSEYDPRSAFDLGFLRKKTPPNYSRPSLEVVRSIDLYCGCGGLSLGAREACRALGKNFLSLAAIDNDPSSLNIYRRNFKCRSYINQDIEKYIDGEIGDDLTRSEQSFLSGKLPVHLLLAGPPCQGYSDLNNHTRRDDPRNALYRRVTRFIEIAKPDHVIVENVPTIIHGKDGEVDEAISVMNDLGYHVEADIVDLSEIGVPQKRNRHVLIGSKKNKVSIKGTIKKYRIKKPRSVTWAISDLVNINPKNIFDAPSRHSEDNMERINYLYENGLFDLPDHKRPICHQNGKHSYKSMYGRMRPDEPAQTITSGFGSPGQGRFIHPKKFRTITPHEAARLQFFPDFFDFTSVKKRTSLAEMIGNAVPMKLSYIFCFEFLA